MTLPACSVFTQPEANVIPATDFEPQALSDVIAEGHIVPKEHANLFFVMNGVVMDILVDEGDSITQGEIIARLGDREALEARRTAAQLEHLSAQQGLDELQINAELASSLAWVNLTEAQAALIIADETLAEIDTETHQENIDRARNEVIDAHSELEDAQETYNKYIDLDEDAINRTRAEDALEEAKQNYEEAVRERDRLINELEQAIANRKYANDRLEEARRLYEAHAEGPDPDDLALAQARFDNAQAQLASAEADLQKMDLIAPFDGTIVKMDLTRGERILPNQVVVILADLSEWVVETSDLSEYEVVSISLGQSARIIPDALPEASLIGKVDSISQFFTERSGDINYLTRLSLLDEHDQLRWGMTVEIQFTPPTE